MNHPPLADWLLNELEAQAGSRTIPAYRSIYAGIRQAILDRRLLPGTRLPSSRELARELGVSRNTTVTAFDLLVAEGFVASRSGSGTYVADMDASRHRIPEQSRPAKRVDAPQMHLSTRGQRVLDNTGSAQEIQPFVPGQDDFSVFPHKLWQRLQNRHWRDGQSRLLDYAPPGGYLPLRRAIAEYLSISRFMQVNAEQVLITAGTQQSLTVCAQILADAGDLAWLENPGYWGARKVFEACDLNVRAIAVDDEGMHPDTTDLAATPRLIYLTPSHHYPTSAVMSLPRRQLLLELAAARRAWILEDDYDSEFRYSKRPLAALQGLDMHQTVIYLGTFSKIMFPGIKMGYMVAPSGIAGSLKSALYDLQRPGQLMLQAALADFIEQGHFASHIRKVRQVYGERRELLVEALTPWLGQHAQLLPEASGMHLVIELAAEADDQALATKLARHGLVVRALSAYYIGPARRKGLLVGYAYVPTAAIVEHGHRLGRLLQTALC